MALDMIKNAEMGKSIQPSSNPRGKLKPPIHTRDTRNISLTNSGKTVILAWVSSHVGITGNQMADMLAKEATKMITTLKLPFIDYKTKIKCYTRRKWQTIWDMSLNDKIFEYQPSSKLEIVEPLPNQRQDIILSRIRIGHAYLTHAYLLKEETAP